MLVASPNVPRTARPGVGIVTGFALSAEQEELVSAVRRVAREELRAIADAGEPGRVNRPLLKAMGRHGLLARLFPGAGGGAGVPGSGGSIAPGGAEGPGGQVAAMDLCLLRETLAQVSTEAETALALQGLGAYPILQAGRPEIVRRWLPAVASGEAVPAFALSEPDAGSDAAALELRAEPDGGGWRLHGSKLWISNAPEADVYAVFARTTPGAGARGVSAFAVPGDRPGLSGERLDLVAPHAIGRLDFDAVSVRPDELLGEVDRGFRVAMGTLDLFRPSVGAFAVGMAQAALDAAVAHARTRRAFGGTLGDLQAVAHMLADMATRVEAARLLVYAAASAYDRGDAGVTARAAMAKLYATEAAQQVVDAAIQVHGARALQRGHPLEHLYREVRAPRIYEGASEVQRTIIGRALLRPSGDR
jgi:acyl-CoA dehydrogenase